MLELLDPVLLFGATCNASLLVLVRLIKNGVIPILQFGIPVLLILFGMIDLGKAVMAGKEDDMKKAQGMLMKRCIYGVAVFFVVLIVTMVFDVVADTAVDSKGNAKTDASAWSTCWNKA